MKKGAPSAKEPILASPVIPVNGGRERIVVRWGSSCRIGFDAGDRQVSILISNCLENDDGTVTVREASACPRPVLYSSPR